MNRKEYFSINILEASAGSGKTYALAKRYIKLIFDKNLKLNEIPIKNILAITFTNKAMIEMKSRILYMLKQIALNSFKDKEEEIDFLSFLDVDKDFAMVKAKLTIDELIRNYDFFSVKTIDSFINSLLIGSALNLGLSLNFKIKKDFKRYIEYSFDLLIEEAHKDKNIFNLLKDFLQNYLFVENKKGWFPKKDILELLEVLFDISTKYGKDFSVFEVKPKNIIEYKRDIYKKIKKISKLLIGLNNQRLKNVLNFLNENKFTFNIQSLPPIFFSDSPPIESPRLKKDWKEIFNSIRRLVELEAKLMYIPYIKLFSYIHRFLEDISRKEDILFLENLNRKAKLLFDEKFITVPEIYYRLATRFNYYLIDEFQDTSLLQWNNLRPLIEDALSSGGFLFYVGDKKQAIYRFRGGDVKLFDELKNTFGRLNIKEEKLKKNWRSHKYIVEFNNMIFSEKNLEDFFVKSKIKEELSDDENLCREITSVFSNSKQDFNKDKNLGYVYIDRIHYKNQLERNEIMKQKLLNLIDELRGRFSFSDIAILTRENYEVELITSWLISENIAVESEKTLNVIEHPLIKEIICFLKFLNSPFDDISFSFFILGDIFSSVSKMNKEEIRDFIFGLYKDKTLNKEVPVYQRFKERYPSLWSEYIEYFFENVGLSSNYELIIDIYKYFSIFDNFISSGAFFMKFLELVKTKEDEYTNLSDFLEYLKSPIVDELYVNVIHQDAISVLTIHKAKGLEFKVVILPFFRIDINPKASNIGSFYLVDVDNRLGLIRIVKNYCRVSKELLEIYKKSYKEACIDELNAIYVALTRAEYELYIFIPEKSNSGKNKAYFLIPENLNEYGKKYIYKKDKLKEEAISYISKSDYRDWKLPIKEEFIDREYIINRDRIEEGNILHTILSKIGNCYKKDIDNLIDEAIGYAKIKFSYVEDFSFYRKKIKDLLNKKELYEIFYIEDGNVFCEKEFVDDLGNLKRIDRLIVKDNEVIVVDFKSSLEIEKQTEQLKEYMKIIKDIYSKASVVGFLVYFDTLNKEEVNL